MLINNKEYLSPSRLIKWLFPEKHENVPQYVLEKAAEQGKDLHSFFQAYVEGIESGDIEEFIYSEKEKRIFESFKKWYDNLKQKSKWKIDTKAEFHAINDIWEIHGFIDLMDFENKIFYDFKLRNLKDELDLTTDILQMIFYENVLCDFQKQINWNWKLVYFDKKTGKVKEFSKEQIETKDYQDYELFLQKAIIVFKEKNNIRREVWNKKKTLKF